MCDLHELLRATGHITMRTFFLSAVYFASSACKSSIDHSCSRRRLCGSVHGSSGDVSALQEPGTAVGSDFRCERVHAIVCSSNTTNKR